MCLNSLICVNHGLLYGGDVYTRVKRLRCITTRPNDELSVILMRKYSITIARSNFLWYVGRRLYSLCRRTAINNMTRQFRNYRAPSPGTLRTAYGHVRGTVFVERVQWKLSPTFKTTVCPIRNRLADFPIWSAAVATYIRAAVISRPTGICV